MQRNNFMISILLASYNDEKYIKQCIDSILNQTYQNFELLIGFNGTTDKSIEIVNAIKDPRIKIYSFEEKGKAKTLNKLLNYSKFDWIAIQDGDDIWKPEKLQEQVKAFKWNDIIGSFILYIDENNNKIGYPNLDSKHRHIIRRTKKGDNQIANSSAIIRKQKLMEINGWDETLLGLEDFDMWLKLIKNKCKFININKYLVLHRLHKESNFNTIDFDVNEILDKNADKP